METEMFERFAKAAKEVVGHADNEARDERRIEIGTEHILLGLLDEKKGVAFQALASMGITHTEVLARVREIHGPSLLTRPTANIPFTPRSKRILELSLREYLRMRDEYIDTEHILLGLLSLNEGDACRVLSDLGIDFEALRLRVQEIKDGTYTSETPLATPASGAADKLEPTVNHGEDEHGHTVLSLNMGRTLTPSQIDQLTAHMLANARDFP